MTKEKRENVNLIFPRRASWFGLICVHQLLILAGQDPLVPLQLTDVDIEAVGPLQ
jgi:hypothetical protein